MGVVSKTSLGDGGGSDRKLTVHSAVTELLLMPRTNHLSPLPSSPLTSHGRFGPSAYPSSCLEPETFLPYRLDLPPLPLSPADEIANEKPLQDWNQRHREDK